MDSIATTPITKDEAEALLGLEARLLDEGRFEDWLGLYAADCTYWVPIERNQKSPEDTVSLMYDDRLLLETRVRRLVHQHPHAYSPPSHTSRLIGNVSIERADAGGNDCVTRSKMVMVEYRNDSQRLFAATVTHHLVRRDSALRIAHKRVDLVNCVGMHDGMMQPF